MCNFSKFWRVLHNLLQQQRHTNKEKDIEAQEFTECNGFHQWSTIELGNASQCNLVNEQYDEFLDTNHFTLASEIFHDQHLTCQTKCPVGWGKFSQSSVDVVNNHDVKQLPTPCHLSRAKSEAGRSIIHASQTPVKKVIELFEKRNSKSSFEELGKNFCLM